MDIEGVDPDAVVTALAGRIDHVLAEAARADRAAVAEARRRYALSHYSWSEAGRAYLCILARLVELASTQATAQGSTTR